MYYLSCLMRHADCRGPSGAWCSCLRARHVPSGARCVCGAREGADGWREDRQAYCASGLAWPGLADARCAAQHAGVCVRACKRVYACVHACVQVKSEEKYYSGDKAYVAEL